MTFPLPAPAAFQKWTATDMGNVISLLNALGDPNYTSYAATLSSSGGGFSLGNGTIATDYRRSANGDEITARGLLTVGSTTNFGTGYLRISLPIAASANAILRQIGDAMMDDISAQSRPGTCRIESGPNLLLDLSAGVVTGTSPATPAAGDTYKWTIKYEAA